MQTKNQNESVFNTKLSSGGWFLVVVLGLAILSLFERVLYDAGRFFAPAPIDYFQNFNVIAIHAVIILFFLVIALIANLSLGERKQKYAVALIPYYVVSIVLAIQLCLQVSVYFYHNHTNTEFYVVMIAICAVATWGMYVVQKHRVVTEK